MCSLPDGRTPSVGLMATLLVSVGLLECFGFSCIVAGSVALSCAGTQPVKVVQADMVVFVVAQEAGTVTRESRSVPTI